MRRIVGLLLLLSLGSPRYGSTQSLPQSSSAVSRLNSLLTEEWDYEMRTKPETATYYGDNRFNDRLSDLSPQFFASDLTQNKKFLVEFEAINPSALDEQSQLNRSLMIGRLRDFIDRAQFKPWEMQIDQFNGVQLGYASLPSLTPFETTRDYENYLSRLHQLPRVFDQVIGDARQGHARWSNAAQIPTGAGCSSGGIDRQRPHRIESIRSACNEVSCLDRYCRS